MHVNAYLTFNGTCEEAFRFYAEVCKGSVEMMMTHEGSPAEAHTPPEWRSKMLHATLKLGESIVMGSDSPPEHYRAPAGMSVSLSVGTLAEAEQIFAALSEGGSAGMPMGETFFAQRFGMCTDRFGIRWMVVCEKAME